MGLVWNHFKEEFPHPILWVLQTIHSLPCSSFLNNITSFLGFSGARLGSVGELNIVVASGLASFVVLGLLVRTLQE